jgi:hypothetical protein
MVELDFCSYFIEEKALFGSFPSQDKINVLEELGVILFVDLTVPNESKTNKYVTKAEYINFPIDDYNVPNDMASFSTFVYKICNLIQNLELEKKIYVHCRGGHGRSGVVVSCILAEYFNISSEEAMSQCNKFHSNRKTMREKWRTIGSPQTGKQKNFVEKCFSLINVEECNIIDYNLKEPSKMEIENFEIILKRTYLKRLFSVSSDTSKVLTDYRRNLYLI